MIHLTATLHVLGLQTVDRARTTLTTDRERGNVTIEQVLWAVAIIAVVGIVVAVIRNYVTTQAAQIQ